MFVWSVLSAVKWFVCVFFFFKQKTAYEMRISDWSSDVCSSDLRALCLGPASRHRKGTRGRSQRAWRGCRAAPLPPAGPDSGGDGNRRLACRISSADVVDRLSARPRGLQDDPRFRRNSAEPGAAAPAAGADGGGYPRGRAGRVERIEAPTPQRLVRGGGGGAPAGPRSEEHTSELKP